MTIDNKRAENSHLPISLPRTQNSGFKSQGLGQRFLGHTCRHLRHFQRPTPSHKPLHIELSPCRGHGNLGSSHGVCLTVPWDYPCFHCKG